MTGEYEGNGQCGAEPHNWVTVGPEPSFTCLNCAAMWIGNAELVYWHACTGTPIPEPNSHAWTNGKTKAVIWRG